MPTVGPVLVAAAPLRHRREMRVPASVAARLGSVRRRAPGDRGLRPAGGRGGCRRRSSGRRHRGVVAAYGPAPAASHSRRHSTARPLGGAHAHRRSRTVCRRIGPSLPARAPLRRARAVFSEPDPYRAEAGRRGLHVRAARRGLEPPASVRLHPRRRRAGTAMAPGRVSAARRRVRPDPDPARRVPPKFAAFRERLSRSVPAWFNQTGFFDKWRMHVELSRNERLRRYLPETALYGGLHDLERFLSAYRTVYVKPVGGSLGLGIIRLQRTAHGFVAAHQPGETLLIHRAPTVRELARIVARLTRRGPYVIQQGLPLARWNGRPFDVRILMQRTTGGAWTLTKMFSRIAAPGRFTANLTRGGQGCRIGLLLRRVYGKRHAALHRSLQEAGFEIAREIEGSVPGVVGELGLDLGLESARPHLAHRGQFETVFANDPRSRVRPDLVLVGPAAAAICQVFGRV